MKHRLQTLLKHKLQWLVLLTALLGMSQGTYANDWGIMGSWDSNTWHAFSDGTNTYSVNLSANSSYTFRLSANYNNYGNNGSISQTESGCNWQYQQNNNLTTLNTNAAGTYTFTICKWENSIPYLNVTFPASATTYYVAGNGSGHTDGWCSNKNWNATGSVMTGNGTSASPACVTFNNVAANNNLQFKVTVGSWSTSYGHNNYSTSKSSLTNCTESNGDGNIKLNTTSTLNITICYDGTNVYVTTVVPCTAPSAKYVYIGGSSATSKTICSTSNTYVRLAASQSGYTYQLKRYNTSTSAWDDVGTAWSSNGTGFHDFTDLSTAGTYKITGYPTGSSSSCNQDMSNTVTLYVDNESVAGNITGAGSICSGESKTLGVSDNTGTVTQWSSSSTSGGTYNPIEGATASTYSASPESTTYYKVSVKNGVCAAATTSSYATVTVNPAATATEYPIEGAVAGEIALSYTGSSQEVTISPESGTGTYTVYYEGTGGTSYDKSDIGPVNVGTYAVTVDANKGDSYCAADGLDVGTLTITPIDQSTAVTILNSGTHCIPSSGSYVDISASGGDTSEALTYSVVGTPSSGISLNTSTGRITANNAGSITVTATRPGGTNYNDKTSSNSTYTFVVTPTTITVTPSSAVEKVLPSSVAQPSVTQDITASHTGNSYAWTLLPNYSVNSIASASSANTTITFKREGVYTATAKGGCKNTTDVQDNSAAITVEPPLTIYLAGTLVSSAGDQFADNNFPMTRTSGSYVYTRRFDAVVGSAVTYTSRKFTLRESSSASQANYIIPKYAKVNYTNISTTGGNNDLYTTGITYSAGDKLEVRAEYKGYNSSENKPEWDISIGLVCDDPVTKTISISDASICRGSDVSVVVNSSQSGYIYTVYDAGNTQVGTTTGDGTNKSISVTRPTESTTYTVKAKQAASCTPTEMANTVSVTINELPTYTPSEGITQYEPVTVTSTALSPSWSIASKDPDVDAAWISTTSGSSTVLKAPTGTYTVSDGNCSTGNIVVSNDTETCD